MDRFLRDTAICNTRVNALLRSSWWDRKDRGQKLEPETNWFNPLSRSYWIILGGSTKPAHSSKYYICIMSLLTHRVAKERKGEPGSAELMVHWCCVMGKKSDPKRESGSMSQSPGACRLTVLMKTGLALLFFLHVWSSKASRIVSKLQDRTRMGL